MDDVWSDTDASPTPSHPNSLLSSEPPSPTPPPSFLTTYQTSLVTAYISHSDRVSDLMNTVVDLEISVRRERDEPSLLYLGQELERAQENLVLHRDGKRKKEREIKREEENLKMVVGDSSIVAKRQLEEIGMRMGRERTVVCLR